MRWGGRQESENVEDRRSMGAPQMAMGGGIGAIVIALIAMWLGADPAMVMRMLANAPRQAQQAPPAPGRKAEHDEMAKFVGVVLRDTEVVWQDLFKKMGKNYRDPKLVLFTGRVESACGFQSAAVGPFYCPPDQKVYIDLAFYGELKDKFKAPGEFAQAYVIAHEVGHHVQNLLGISAKVHQQQQRAGEREANDLSVRLELQADFFAGVWAHHAQVRFNILEPGDIEAALTAAAAIGDDTLQKRAGRTVSPESFTHGTSKQRVKWFRKGFDTGDMKQGNTFEATDL